MRVQLGGVLGYTTLVIISIGLLAVHIYIKRTMNYSSNKQNPQESSDWNRIKKPTLPHSTDCWQSTDHSGIPAFMFGVIDLMVMKQTIEFPKCRKRDAHINFVYIKNHKCASDTLSAMFRKFAIDRELTVVLPIGRRFNLGWPHQLAPYMYRPAKTQYNLLLDHVVYNHSYMSQIMPENTRYFTSLREPFGRLTSALTYFAMANCALMPESFRSNRLRITEGFLSNMDHYDTVYKSIENLWSREKCGCIPNGVSMIKNGLAFDLGFPVGYHTGTVDQSENYVYIIKWLIGIYQQMPLVILIEHFEESMVLVKRYMCWTMKDILYKRLNDWHTPKAQFQQYQIQQFRNWSNVDTLLYYLYNRTFWKHIRSLGEDFKLETKEYISQLQRTTKFCDDNKRINFPDDSVTIPSTLWNSQYTVTHEDCMKFHDKKHLREEIKAVHDLRHQLLGTENVHPAMHSGYNWC